MLVTCAALQGLVVMVCALLAALPATGAQPSAKIPRIGFFQLASPPDPNFEAFRDGLRQLGYVEGQNVVIEYRWTMEGDRLPDLAAELVRLQVDVIVAGGSPVNPVARKATSTIPIVMALMGDPTGQGFVASLARPGGNITGLSFIAPELSGKRLELLKEAFPRISRVGVVWDSRTGSSAGDLEATRGAARALGVQLQVLEVRGGNDLDKALEAARRDRARALLTLSSPMLFANRTHLVGLAAASRLPVMYHHREYVDIGGLMSYGPSYRDLFRRAATYVDKILKGAKPADLPVEQPTRFELVINMRTAKALGLTIPRSLLSLADQVIQ